MKKTIAVFLMLLNFAVIGAMNQDELFEKAKEGGYYKKLKYNLDETVLSLKRSILEDSNSYEGGVKNIKFSDIGSSDSFAYGFTPYFSFQSKEENTTSVMVEAPVTLGNSPSLDKTWSPQLEFSQKIYLNAYKDKAKSLLRKKTEKQIYLEKEQLELEYYSDILSFVKSLISSRISYLKAKNSYSKQNSDFERSKDAGMLEEGTTEYAERASALAESRNSANLAEISLQTAESVFKTNTGLDASLCDELRIKKPEKFDFTINPDGNTSVLIDKMTSEIYRENYNVYKYNGSDYVDFHIEGGAELGMPGNKYISSSGALGASYNSSNARINIDGGFTHLNESRAYPYVSASVSVFNNSDKEKSDNEEQRLLIQMQNSDIAYMNSLSDYLRSANELKAKMNEYDFLLSKAEMEYDRAKLVFTYKSDLNDKGYLSEQDFSAAFDDYKISELEYELSLIDLIILNINAKILSL